MTRYKAIISYPEIVKREGVMLQRGMNFRVKPSYSIFLMSVRKGAPYKDRWHEESGILEYEGHDVPHKGAIDPKKLDQPMTTANGNLSENGKFFEAARAFATGKASSEIVQVYEKIATGIWCDRGRYALVDATIRSEGRRKVFKFFLKPSSTPRASDVILRQSRIIPTSVKVEVWRRDYGRCVICGSEKNLHFDHEVPYSKGGSSITEANVRLLCAKHNLSKSNKIMGFAPWVASLGSLVFSQTG